MSYTPGPWRTPIWDRQRILTEESKYIARTWSDLPGKNKLTVDEAEANARLIAAAPDLLEACKELLGWFHGDLDGPFICPCCGVNAYDGHSKGCAVELAAQALAKAEGS